MGNVYGKTFEILAPIMIFLFLTNAFSYFLFLRLLNEILD